MKRIMQILAGALIIAAAGVIAVRTHKTIVPGETSDSPEVAQENSGNNGSEHNEEETCPAS